MRLVPKYSHLYRASVLTPFFVAARVARFRRSKWLRWQRLERKLPRRRLFFRRFKRGGWRKKKKKFLDSRASKLFVTSRSKRCALHKWSRARFLYKASLLQKRRLISLHDASINKRVYANVLCHRSQQRARLLTKLLVKPEFRLDLLLWRLQFFNSVYSAQCAIRTGRVLVNGVVVKTLHYVEVGDVVRVAGILNVKKVMKKYRLTNFLPQFFEVDYYQQCFVVLKGYEAVSFQDANVFLRVPFSLSLLRFFFSK